MNEQFGNACKNDDVEVVKLLLINKKNSDFAINYASMTGCKKIVKLLLTDYKVNLAKDTLTIQLAAQFGHTECVKELSIWYLEHGYTVDDIINIINIHSARIDLAKLREYLEELNMIKYAGRT